MAEGKDDSVLSFTLFWLLFIGVLIVFWYAFRPQLAQGIFWLRQGEMYIASFWVDDEARISPNMKDPVVRQEIQGVIQRHRNLADPREFQAWQNYLESGTYNPAQVQVTDVAYLTKVTLEHYREVLSVLMILMGIIVLYYGPTSLFRREFSVEALLYEQSKVFPHMKPFIKFNPLKMDVRAPGSPVPSELPIFSEALSPEEWIAYNNIPMPDDQLDADIAFEAFAAQLGPRWQGIQKLEPYQRILLAGFCLKANRKRLESDLFIGRLTACWDHQSGLKLSRDRKLLSEAMKILRNKSMSEKMLKVMRQHAYRNTALMRALDFARSEGGVLAPSLFIWLRAHDRHLWYALNNLGKKAFHMEALGAMGHYLEEKRTHRPIPIPKVKDAVQALSDYMADPILARPIPQLDYKDKPSGKAKGKKESQESHKKSKGIMKPAGSA